ncbi:MAG TPA: molybdate ABC transporter permease subunit [bacterium]|jgi:molybdate transport system permease protein|nr:molybdate ABC transporter permease subunit [bacterium]
MDTLRIFVFTASCAVVAVLLALPAATGLGWLLARKNWPGKALFETMTTLPLVLPPVATGLILLDALGRRGWIGAWVWSCFGADIAFTEKAVVVAMGVMAFPLLAGSARAAFEEVPRRQEDLARTLGLSEAQVFRRVSLPLARRGLLSGALLGYARALGEFGATITLAGAIPGRTETLASAIYSRLQLGQDDSILPLLLLSLAAAFCLVWVSQQWLRPPRGAR